MSKHFCLVFIQFLLRLFDECICKVSFAQENGVFNEFHVILEVEVLVQNTQQFVSGAELSCIDPVCKSAIGHCVECSLDVEWFDFIGNNILAFLFYKIYRLACDKYLKCHIITGEKRDEVHKYLEHFRPFLSFRAVVVFGDEEFT